ncbi:MAG: flagellar biosynthetic protein FliR [Gammaproteobacteria bacterium]|nr:flagellar biosynthetic protein FliR [Gammaproteobacteria bacterium]MDH5594178.1 flagellar biosynthetic protein FliR [Gammaproteobacteria bacterium]
MHSTGRSTTDSKFNMDYSSAQIGAWVGTLFWPFCRIAALMSVSPILGMKLIPARIRVVLAIMITMVVAPLIPSVPQVDVLSPDGILIIIQQVLIGLSMGFVLQMVFGVFTLGGQVIAMSMALGFASMNDPISGISVPTVSQLFTILVTLTFLAFNGHLIAIEVIADSFRTLPIGTTGLALSSIHDLISWASYMFIGAVLISLPAIASMLVINLGFGIMTRSAPQLNIFVVGFPVIITMGFVVIVLTLPSISAHLTSMTDSGFELMRSLARGG